MADNKNAFAATALAESPLAAAPTTNPNAPIAGMPITNPNAPTGMAQSGVGPASHAVGSSADLSAGQGPIGRTIHGRYKIKRLLGEGGMGGVYEGEHLEVGRRVAIKLVHSLHARDPHIAARIKQEARSTGSIESENIVQVFDAGEDPDLGLFLVMELLKGEDLGALLQRKKHVSPMAAATMVVQASQGLARAHAAGIVHRDLKPANIFLCTRDDGSSLVKLVDFGIAKLVRDANQAAQQGGGLTRMGMVIGTPQYMSPEQAQGLLTVDHRTDIYSLGAVLFEAIVGTSPYQEMPTYEQTILQIMTRPAPRISQFMPSVHPELDQLCAEMMAHDPNARPQDMMTVRERIVRIFPEIDGGRLPMRSLTNEAGYEATVSADASGQLRAMRDEAFARAGLSGVGAAVPRSTAVPSIGGRPSTNTGVAASAPGTMNEEEPVADVAGVPQRRNGAIVAVVGLLALLVGIGGVAVVKMKSGSSEPAPTSGGYGLVQSTVATPTTPAPSPAPPQPTVAAPVAPPPPVAAAPAPAARSDKSSRTASGKAPKPSVPAAAPPPAAAPAPADKGTTARPVGGTGLSQEF